VTVPMVGKIVSVSVKWGDKIKEDDQVAGIRSDENGDACRSTGHRTVKEVCVASGQEWKQKR